MFSREKHLPATAALVPDAKSVRPDGTACQIQADLDEADKLDKAGKGAYVLTLTEFPDPDGQWTYFQLADPKVAVEDELLSSDTISLDPASREGS